MSMVDPKGAGPKIRGKSKAYELIERDTAELVQIDEPEFDLFAPKFTELRKMA